MQNQMKRKKELFIECLRIFACILVVLYHSRYQVYSCLIGGVIVAILIIIASTHVS